MRLILLAVGIFLSVISYAQDDMRVTLNKYLKLSEEKNSEQLMDYMYPKFFELFPRDIMIKALDKSLNDPAFEIILRDSEILSISPQKTVDSVTYAIADYSFVMSLKYVESEENSLPDQSTIDLTKDIFNNMYGEDNVYFSDEEKKFTIRVTKNMLVLKTPLLTSWKVLGTDANLKPLLLKIIPKEIVDEL